MANFVTVLVSFCENIQTIITQFLCCYIANFSFVVYC